MECEAMEVDLTDPLDIEMKPELELAAELEAAFTLDAPTPSHIDPLAVDMKVDVDEPGVKQELQPVPRSPSQTSFLRDLLTSVPRTQSLQSDTISQFGDFIPFVLKPEPEEVQDSQYMNTDDSLTLATSIQPFNNLIEEEPGDFGNTGFFHVQLKSEAPTDLLDDDCVNQALPNSDPLTNSLILTRELALSCDLCSYQGNNKRNLTRHQLRLLMNKDKRKQRSSLSKQQHESSYCLRNTSSQDCLTKPVQETDLLNNSLVHIFSCDICSYQCASRENLACHKLSHYLEKYEVRPCFVSLTRCDSSNSTSITLPSSSKDNVSPKNLLYSCELCSFQGKSKRNLSYHKRRHLLKKDDGKQASVCLAQQESSSSFTLPSSNMDIDHDTGPVQITDPLTNSFDPAREVVFSCDLCPYQGKAKRNLTQHKRRHLLKKGDGKQASVCLAQQESSSSFTLPSSNMDIDHNTDPVQITDPLTSSFDPAGELVFSCDLCPYQGKAKRNLTQHKRRHLVKNDQWKPCSFLIPQHESSSSNILPSSSEDNDYTELSDHSDEKHQCSQCEYSSVTKSDLEIHLITHSSARLFACNICSVNCNSNEELTDHKRSHALKKKFKCSECKHRSVTEGDLEIHLRIHSNLKLFACDLCPYTSDSKRGLAGHKGHHSQEKLLHQCKHCEYSSISRIDFDIHRRTHSSKRLFFCKICSFICYSKEALRNHELSHSSEKRYKCDVCKFECMTLRGLNQHKIRVCSVKKYNCSQCDYGTNNKFMLESHLFMHSSDGMFACKICCLICDSNEALTNHKLSHSSEKRYKCDVCKFECMTFRGLIRHKMRYCSVKKYNCSQCYYGTSNKYMLESHLFKHSSERHFACNTCSFNCNSNEELTEHELMHSSEKSVKCSQCDYSSNTKSDLEIHLKTHSSAQSFASETIGGWLILHKTTHRQYAAKIRHTCRLCNYWSFSKTDFDIHLQTHSSKQLFACNICLITCNSNEALTEHERSHSSGETFKCSRCEYSSDTKTDLENHLQTHSSERFSACNLCSLTCDSREALAKHELNHSPEKRHKCDVCNLESVTVRGLQQHVMLNHFSAKK